MENKEELFTLISSQHAEETKSLFYRYILKWHWFLFFSVVGVLIGFLFYIKLPNTYQISSRILVNGEEKDLNSILSFNNNQNDFGGNQTNLENQIGILRSYTLYRNALNNLNWKYSWFEKKTLYKHDLYKNNPFELLLSADFDNAKNIPLQIEVIDEDNYHLKIKGDIYKDGIKKRINVSQSVMFGSQFSNEFFRFTIKQINGEIGKKYFLIFNDIDYLTKSYLSLTEIFAENEKSDFITIFIEGRNREREADFINELNRVFIEFGVKSKFENSENSVKFIDQQLERLKNSLGTAEENYSNYRRNNQVMDLGQEAQTVYSRLEEIEQDKYLTQMQLDYYNGLQQSLDNADKIGNMVNPSIVGISDANLTNMITKLIELYSRKEALSVSVQDKNPTLLIIDNQIKVTRDGLEQAINNQKESTQLKINRLEEQYGIVQQRLRKLPDTERKLIGVQREFDLNNDYYNYMLQKKAEMSISKSSIVPKVQIIDNAIVEAAKQTGPNLIMTLAFGLVGGNTIPFILITLISFFSNKIESIIDVEKRSNIRVLEGIMKHKYKANLPVIQHPRSGIAESFRGLKSNINILTDKTDSKVISINSLIPEEGKSFVSSNLSAAIARSNKKVLLIGADLHKPTLHKFLGIKEAVGLSNYLNNDTSIEDIIFETPIVNLYCIQAGFIVDNPSEIIDRSKFDKLLEQTKKMFDFIIIDNAPLLLIPDAIFTSQYSDLSLFILRVNYSHKDEIKQINKIVEFNKIDKAAIVMNDTPQNGYGYGYGKKYWKKGYGEYRKEKRLFSV